MNRRQKIICSLGWLMALFMPFVDAQNWSELDSLKTLLHTSKDTAHVRKLTQIGQIYARYRIADSTYHYANQALAKSIQFEDKTLEATSLNLVGWALDMQKRFAEGLDYLNKSIHLWEALKDDKGLSVSYNSLGRIYTSMRSYEKAQACYLQSLKLALKVGDVRGEHIAYQNLAIVFNSLKRHKDAIRYRSKALRYAQKTKSFYSEAIALMGMGSDYRSLERLDSAYYCHKRSLKLARDLEHDLLTLTAGFALTYTAIKMERFEVASQVLEELPPFIDEKDKRNLGFLYNYKAEILFGLKKHGEAIQLAQEHLDIAYELKDTILLNNAYFQLYEFYKKLENDKKALSNFEALMAIQDSIYKKDQEAQIQTLEIQYETEKKEAQIANLKQETQIKALQLRQSSMMIAFLVIIALLIIGLLYFSNRQRLLKEEFKRFQTEQRLLRTQMNPHFFFHALSSIQAYILSEDDKKNSVRYLSKFSKLMRNVLDSSLTDSISLEKEIQMLENYIALQQLRYDKKFQYEITIDESIKADHLSIPPLLFQPIVENAIEHGLVPKKQKGLLGLNFLLTGKTLKVVIDDNGIGRNKPTKKIATERKSIALNLVRERLQLLAKNKGYKASMEVIDLKDNLGKASGTKVVFHLPQHNTL